MHPQAVCTDWKLWCRLCAKEDPENNFNIFSKEEQILSGRASNASGNGVKSNNLGLVDAVRKYFWVNIASGDELPKMLCTECFSRVTSMVIFSERVCKVQQMFWTLKNSHVNTKLCLQSLRLKLLDEEGEHAIQRHLPEVYYVEEKPIIDYFEEYNIQAEMMAYNPLEPGHNLIKTKKKDVWDKENESSEDSCELGDGDIDFVNDTGSERDDVVEEIFEQKTFESITRKRNQIINVTVSQREEKHMVPSKKPNNKDKLKLKPTKRNEYRTVEQNAEDVYDVGATSNNKDFGSNTGIEKDNVDGESFAQTKFVRDTMNRKQRIGISISQQEEKYTNSSRKRQCRAKRNCTALVKGKENTKQSKVHDVEKRNASNKIYIEDKSSTESDNIHDIDFVPSNYIKETKEKTEVKIRKRAKKIKGVAVCDVCNKVFQNHYKLRRHQEIHDSSKHTCPECGLQLNTRATFKQHMVVHSAEMKYKCDYCGRGFKRIKTMQNHLMLHTGLRPYLCEFCGRTFPTSVNCRTHKTLAHRKELAAVEASGGRKTVQDVGNQKSHIENSQIMYESLQSLV